MLVLKQQLKEARIPQAVVARAVAVSGHMPDCEPQRVAPPRRCASPIRLESRD